MAADTQMVLFNPFDSIQVRFEKFHRLHPEVYVLFVKYAREMKAAGKRKYSSDALLHRVRWHADVNPDRHFEGFKINDHNSSRYARLLAETEPKEFGDFFYFRKLGKQRRQRS